MLPISTAALLYSIQQPRYGNNLCPWMDEWIKKLWYIDTMKYYSAIKIKCFPFVKTWIDTANIMVSKIRQAEKDKYYIFSLLCGILKTNKQKSKLRNR